MKKHIIVFTFVVAMVSMVSFNFSQDPTAAFVLAAADASTMEMKLGELALKKSPSARMKEFAKTMISDHGKMRQELKSIATKKNITIPSGLTLSKQVKYDSLELQKEQKFDAMYAKIMIRSHEDAVKLFEKQASAGQDPMLKKWASEKLTALRHHLEMANMLGSKN